LVYFSKPPCFPEIGLFSRATCHSEIKKIAYFQGQPALFQLQKEFQQAFMLP
jgi:hypothetical protein